MNISANDNVFQQKLDIRDFIPGAVNRKILNKLKIIVSQKDSFRNFELISDGAASGLSIDFASLDFASRAEVIIIFITSNKKGTRNGIN